MTNDLFVEIESCQRPKHGEKVCGDTFRSRKVRNEGRIISVLSDGLGKGVKANILSTMTASMALKLIAHDYEIIRSAETIMDALPTCRVRKLSYATFTVVDNRSNSKIRVIEMGNPPLLLIRDGRAVPVDSQALASGRRKHRGMRIYNLEPRPEDRLILLTDGITEAGLGSERLKKGWRLEGCRDFVLEQVRRDRFISAGSLAGKIVNEALRVEPCGRAEDDMTAVVLYFRQPRNLLVLSGPPFARERDREFAELVDAFAGRKVICGGTTADIVARELGLEITTNLDTCSLDVPPTASIGGVDLVTEGILTLTKVAQCLEQSLRSSRSDAAGQLLELLRSSDSIEFVVGTRINEAHQDPSHPADLEIRRNIIKRIARVLEEGHLKDVHIRYI